MQGFYTYDELDLLKDKVNELFKKKKTIHVNVNETRVKKENVPSTITGVYTHFFCVTSTINKYVEDFSIRYSDLKNGKYSIKELD